MTWSLLSPGQSAKQLEVAKGMLIALIKIAYELTLSHGHRTGVLKPYLDKARSIALIIHPFANIQRAFYAGVPETGEDKDEE